MKTKTWIDKSVKRDDETTLPRGFACLACKYESYRTPELAVLPLSMMPPHPKALLAYTFTCPGCGFTWGALVFGTEHQGPESALGSLWRQVQGLQKHAGIDPRTYTEHP